MPNRWIGVQAGWQLLSKSPLPHMVTVAGEDLDRQTLVIGQPGAGKTNLFHHLLQQDMQRKISVCVLNMRGDLVSAGAEIANGLVKPANIKILDPRERARPFGFCPLQGSGEPYFRALGVLDAIEAVSESWGVQLAETSRFALMALAETGRRLNDLEPLLTDRSFRGWVRSQIKTESVANFWSRFDSLSQEKQASLTTPVLNKFSALFAPQGLAQILGHPSPIDLAKQINTPGSVTLVSLAIDELHSSGKMFGAMFLASLCREVFTRVSTGERHRVKLRLYVDEFEHFSGSDFETIFAEGRRFGFSIVVAHQTLVQLTPRMRSLILNSVGTKFVFRCGREDAATLAKDIFGDPRAYDLTELPVGYCVLWRRDVGVDEVEVNEPLIRNVGHLSPSAKSFLNDIYSFSGGIIEARPVLPIVTPPAQSSLDLPPATTRVAADHAQAVQPSPKTAKPPARTAQIQEKTTETKKAQAKPKRPQKPVAQPQVNDLEDWLCD
ncbi:MAG: type IV secretion system DNA-binding domain-containing protein [Methanoregulaceae archaeon]|nr:type IV secretion system DNA-binding domain-containing protein [Methanoregulaceae archaeon]